MRTEVPFFCLEAKRPTMSKHADAQHLKTMIGNRNQPTRANQMKLAGGHTWLRKDRMMNCLSSTCGSAPRRQARLKTFQMAWYARQTFTSNARLTFTSNDSLMLLLVCSLHCGVALFNLDYSFVKFNRFWNQVHP